MRTIASKLGGEYQFSVWFVYEDGPLVDWLRRSGVDARYVPWRPSVKNPSGPLRLGRAARSAHPDLIHHHSADARVRWIVRHATGAPILLHLHGRAAESATPVPQQISTYAADRVITVSRAVSDFTQTTSEVVYTGVEVGTNGRRDSSGDEIVFGTAGRLVALKAVDRLLRVFAQVRQEFPAARLEIAGDGEERARLEAQAAALFRNHEVRFLGWQDDIRPTMRRWSAYVQPSLEEGMPRSLLEAMAEGLPVVATAVGGIPEAVIDGETGFLVRSGDDDGMASRIKQLSADAALRHIMGERGRSLVEQRFSTATFIGRIRHIYDAMLRSGR